MSTSVEVPADVCACIKGSHSASHSSELSFRCALLVPFGCFASSPQPLRPQDLIVCSEGVLVEKRVAIGRSQELLWEKLGRLKLETNTSFLHNVPLALSCEFSAVHVAQCRVKRGGGGERNTIAILTPHRKQAMIPRGLSFCTIIEVVFFYQLTVKTILPVRCYE